MPATYDAKNMIFKQLGNSGLRVSKFSLGGWLTYGGTVDETKTKEIMKVAFEAGINTFDTAEVYSAGACEVAMGKAIKELEWQRQDYVIITKIFFGVNPGSAPNARGLSRKHIQEGTKASLERLQLHNVDVVMAHRPDSSVPMEEIVRAFNWVLDKGYAYYWGTSEWSAEQISEAHGIASRLNLVAPIADQCQYSALVRDRLEKEYEPLFAKYRYGTTIWSPLASGLLTGKYSNGIPEDSRFSTNSAFFNDTIKSLETEEGKAKLAKVKGLGSVADELGCTTAVLALAWAAHNDNVSTVILGASKPEQVIENLQAIDVLPKLTPQVMEKIEKVLDNKPAPTNTFGR